MPLYEYRCKACNAVFEKLVFGANPAVSCEKCGSDRTEKLLSRFGMGRSISASLSPSSGSGCGGCSSSSCAGCK
ncbi:MAG TPA: zinc ribbon domain-containing protein [Nitrospirota bacterium]|nr:zinc ribbon domain-containing protein [Nitrospirota bacterium]